MRQCTRHQAAWMEWHYWTGYSMEYKKSPIGILELKVAFRPKKVVLTSYFVDNGAKPRTQSIKDKRRLDWLMLRFATISSQFSNKRQFCSQNMLIIFWEKIGIGTAKQFGTNTNWKILSKKIENVLYFWKLML